MIYTTLLLTALVETVRGHARLLSETASVDIRNLLKEIEAERGFAEEPLGEMTVARRRPPTEEGCGTVKKMDCKASCPPGWRELYRTDYGCCASIWSCFGIAKVCQKECAWWEDQEMAPKQVVLQRLEELQMCGSTARSAGQILYKIAEELMTQEWSSRFNTCYAMKALVLPHLQACMLRDTEKTMTLYAGFTFDGSVIASGARAVGAYIDSTGKTGCFSTTCIGAGLNFGVGVGIVAGLLFGDATNDLPGIGFGGEIGGEYGVGADFAAGTTTSGAPYVEITVGQGVGVTWGFNGCNTDTQLASEGTFFPEAQGPLIEGGFSGAGRR